MNPRQRHVHQVPAALIALCIALPAGAVTWAVGPGQPLAELDEVPWETLAAGDVVAIHARAQPYRGKFVLARSGSAAQPIVVRGVADAGGALPVIDGNGATTRRALDYWNEDRAVIKVGGASTPAGPAEHIVIESLVVRGAHPAYGFIDDHGNPATYRANAAAIFIEDANAIVIRRCELTDSGNGLFVANLSSDITVEESYLHGNGNVGSIYEHNSYTEALVMSYRFNRFGPLRAGAAGNNLKDRSARLVVAYNWIEDGNRQLDLVESSTFATTAPGPYAQTFVYGNVLVEHDGEGNRQIVHYGGDGGNTNVYRKGTLYFYHNTVVSERGGRTTLFRLSTNDERADIRGNVFFNAGGAQSLELASSAGQYDFIGNWLRADYVTSFDTGFN
ncbi:MAG: right-handed parallel beta-helix repeat-containing protein, partial [Gammaproteobacteria bacterium]